MTKSTTPIPKGYKQTKIGILPVEWEVKYFKDIINIRSGQVDPKEEPYASMFLVAPNHIESGSGAISKYETAKLQGAISGKYEVQAGDIIYSKIRPYLKKAAIAKVDCICSADMYAIDGIDATNEYLLSAMLGGHFTNYANSVSARTGMPKINRQDLLAYKIPRPPRPPHLGRRHPPPNPTHQRQKKTKTRADAAVADGGGSVAWV
jgi:type I restriction enzyme S subunit